MSTRTYKPAQIGIGVLLALTAGAPPVLADDTELMLMMPEVTVKPNILFMLDTSGSMDGIVRTTEPYNPNETYPIPQVGGCKPDAVYWTDVDVTPSCTSGQYILESAFKCAAATNPLKGIGSYTDTMVQRRATASPEVYRWQELESGNDADPVECMADSGEHGAGVTGEVYASNDNEDEQASGFTSDPARELAWGSAPATVTYTVYDGNYLNWKKLSPQADVKKIDILKAVTTAVLNSISDVNVGIMRFNDNDGGVVIKAMSDLDADRADILQTVAGLPAQGNTPLAEVMYEGALYWRGGAPHFGNGHAATDPAAVDGAGSYNAPETQQCSKNYNILLSDGKPQDSNDEALALATADLPGFAGCDDDTSLPGACLDDIAAYLATTGLDGDPDNDDQVVTTHTIGFAIDVQNLGDTAAESGGRYFLADDVETLTSALLNIFSDITKQSLSFAAPAVSVNTFNRTQNLNDLYITVFQPDTKVHWPGNLKKYRIENGRIVDGSSIAAVDPKSGFLSVADIWSDTDGDNEGADARLGGAAHKLPAPDVRTLWTNAGGALVDLNNSTVDSADFGLTGAAGEPTVDELKDWMHGLDIRDENLNDDITEMRNAMGDPLHSQPAAVVYGGSPAAPDVVVFFGTNDGYLHAVDGDTGEELWAFVPAEFLGDMERLYFNPSSNFKHYGVDGSIVPVVFDDDSDGIIEKSAGDFVYIVFGLRRGGNGYYALDVTDKANPSLKWVKHYPEFGHTWSPPVIARVDTTSPDDHDGPNIETRDAVVIVGGGYDPVHDTPAAPEDADSLGVGIHMLDLETGDRVWWSGVDSEFAGMTRAFPTQVRVIDMSGDGYADRMYAADVGGRIWRFDITHGSSDLVDGGVIADLGTPGADEATATVPRRFYNAPDVAIFNDPVQGRRFISISIGSGYRAHPLNEDANDMFFSVRDPHVFDQLADYSNYDVVTVDDLVTVTPGEIATIGPEKDGWKLQLPADQAIIADSLTFNDTVIFVAFSPDVNTTNPCHPTAGTNFAYQVSVVNGNFAVNNLDSPVDKEETEYATEIAQGGIAPGAAALFPGSTDPDCEAAECAVQPIICIGGECFNPDFANNPVRTLWTQDGIE